MSHQPRRTASAGSDASPSTGASRRPVRHTVEVRTPNSAGPIRPNRVVPGLSAASREAIQRSGSSASSAGGESVITPFHQHLLNSNLVPAPGSSHSTNSRGGTGSSSNGRGRLTQQQKAASAFRGIEEMTRGGEAEHEQLFAEVMRKRAKQQKREPGLSSEEMRERHQSVMSNYSQVVPNTARSTTASSLGLYSATSTATSLSMHALSKMERALGKDLPLSKDGGKVILSKQDVVKIKDADTLAFLAQYGSLFVKNMVQEEQQPQQLPQQEDESNQPTASSSSAEKKGFSASDVAATMDRLAQEIATFITATDEEGKNYSIPMPSTEDGELHVPLINGDVDGEGADLLLDNEKDLTGFEDVLQENTPDQIRSSDLDTTDPTQDPDTEETFQRKLQEVLSDETEMQLLLGDEKEEKTGEEPSQEDAGIPEEVEGDVPLVEASKPEEPKKTDFKFKSTWCSKPTKKQSGGNVPGTGSSDTSSNRVPLGTRSSGNTQSSSSACVQGPTKSLEKDAFYRLSQLEEARVAWLLDNEDWDTKVMGGGSDAETGSQATTTLSSNSKLTYDAQSASSYAPVDGYGADGDTQKRLSDIDSQLARLQKVRQGAGGLALEDGTSTLKLLTAQSREEELEDDEEVMSEGIKPTPTKQQNVAAGRGKNGAQIPTPPPKNKKQREEDEADATRLEAKRKANDGVNQQKTDRMERKKMNQLNDKLKDISSQLELLSQPPFSLEVQYDLDQDPSELQYPPGLAPPSEDDLQKLLAQCYEEQRLFEDLAPM